MVISHEQPRGTEGTAFGAHQATSSLIKFKKKTKDVSILHVFDLEKFEGFPSTVRVDSIRAAESYKTLE